MCPERRKNDAPVEAADWRRLLTDIRSLIVSARRTAVRAIDTIQVLTNFEIGRRIVEHEQQGERRAEYGKKVLKKISEHLGNEFGKGFSLTNLKLMRQFYLLKKSQIGRTSSDQLPKGLKSQTPSGQLAEIEKKTPNSPFTLSWSHYVFLMGIDDNEERDFYEIESAAQLL